MFDKFQNDFRIIAIKTIAWFLRRPVLSALLRTLVIAINDVNALLITLRGDIQYLLTWNSQIIMLEKMLNDKFNAPTGFNTYNPNDPKRANDISNRLIIWIESLNTKPFYMYNKVEQVVPKLYMYNKAEGMPPLYFKNIYELFASNSFIVHVPTEFQALPGWDIILFRSYIETYRLASKSFTIVFY